MELNIKLKEDQSILVMFGKQKLTISEESKDWNNEGINNFLITLASDLPDDEKIELKFEELEDQPIYDYIVKLFKTFATSYNEELEAMG